MPDTFTLPLTSRTYVVISIARGIAAAMGHEDLTPAHIALGILREGENPAVAILRHAALSDRELRHDLETLLPPRGHPRFGEVVLPVTSAEQEIVELALAEARSLGDPYLGTEHLLIAILGDSESTTAQAFSRRGLTRDAALTHLESVRVRHP